MIKSTLIKGTFILTLAGFLTRILGFFYKIYLSNILGSENLGIYQLIFPIYSLFFTLYAGGIQTAISKLVAEHPGKKILTTGVFLSLSLAFLCSILLYTNSNFFATAIIKEPRCEYSLKLLALVFPFCSITSCINGFYYGLKKTSVPAITQLLEQIARIAFSYFIVLLYLPNEKKLSCEFAILAMAVGEAISALYNLCSLIFLKTDVKKISRQQEHLYKKIILFAFPLTVTHLIVSILHSVESILIPNMLKLSGLTSKEALCIYGVLTGMSMSLLMFPSTITNSLSVLLLPSISEAKAANRHTYIKSITENTIKYSLFIGLFCTFVFLLFGNELGYLFFHNELSGTFLRNLSWLCPLLYLGTTLSSILNGVGLLSTTFITTIGGLSLRVFLLIILVPSKGIAGYFIALLISQFVLTLLNIYYVKKSLYFSFDAYNWLVKPIFFLVFWGFFILKIWRFFHTHIALPSLILLGICCSLYFLLYGISITLQNLHSS